MLALVNAISNSGVDRPVHAQLIDVLARRLWVSTLFAAVAALVVGVGGLIATLHVVAADARARQVWVVALLLLVGVDIYHFKFGYLFARSETIAPSQRMVERSAPQTYQRRRDISLKDSAISGSNPRLNATLAFSRCSGGGCKAARRAARSTGPTTCSCLPMRLARHSRWTPG
jgi:hypothetical protein